MKAGIHFSFLPDRSLISGLFRSCQNTAWNHESRGGTPAHQHHPGRPQRLSAREEEEEVVVALLVLLHHNNRAGNFRKETRRQRSSNAGAGVRVRIRVLGYI